MICLLKHYVLLNSCNNNVLQAFWVLSKQKPKVKLASKLPAFCFSTSKSFDDAIENMPKPNKPKHKKGKGSKQKSKEHKDLTSERHHTTTTGSQDTAKKKLKKKKKRVTDDASAITKAFAKLNVTADKTAIQKRQSSSFSTRSLSHSAGSSRSSGRKLDTLEDVARLILSKRAKNIVVMCGAGISTASGIPDFRTTTCGAGLHFTSSTFFGVAWFQEALWSKNKPVMKSYEWPQVSRIVNPNFSSYRTPGTGLYDNLQRYNIPYPTAVFDLDYFYAKPKPFFELAKELYPSGKYRPNIAHYFLRGLHEKGLLLRLYTQNIDGLERLAGIPSSKLVEAHGTFTTATCTKCGKKYNGEQIKHKILKGIVPRCELTSLCWGVVKPDIVFFGEDLPKRFYYYLKDFPLCDMLIVMGTSLEVEPFASLVDSVRPNVPRLLLNREKVGPFKSRRRSTDVVATGELVETIRRFSTVLGWKSFVQDMMENYEKEAVEKESATENQSDSQTDSGISSASSVSSDQQKETTPKKSLPPPDSNVKRYFHTLRSTPLPRFASEGNIRNNPGEPASIPSTVSYYDFIRNSTKSDNQTRKNVAPSSKFKYQDNALQLLDMQTLSKAHAPVIQYAHVEKRKDKRTSCRILSSVSTPALRKSSKTSSESSESESDSSSESNSSSDS